jgi:LysM repeat protein
LKTAVSLRLSHEQYIEVSMKIRLNMILLVLALMVPCLALSAEQEEPTIYVIKQGDTLWGLSERFIKDPHYWPNMWSKNGQITNPHLIYPGQKVRVFPDRLEFVPLDPEIPVAGQSAPVSTIAATPSQPLGEVAAEKTYSVRGNEGFLLENGSKPAGTIIGIHNHRVIAGDDDIVYTDIGRSRGLKGGEKFSIFRKEGNVAHPKTDMILGTKIIPLGTLQITDLEQNSSRAIITKNYREISPGAALLPYREGQRREVSLKMPTRDLKGYIVDSYTGTYIIAAGDIVFIDLGSVQGAEPGNMLYIVRDVALDQKLVEGRINKLPQELLGALVILDTRNNTATAVVVKSIDAIYKGDRIITQTK